MGVSQVFSNTFKSSQRSIPRIGVSKKRSKGVSNATFSQPASLTTGQIISAMPPVPDQSIMLGRCADGLPFLLTLRDPALGAILISGDKGCGKTHQLQVIADTAIRLNAPHELQIAILTAHPEEWVLFQKDQNRNKYLQEICAWYDDRVEVLIKELTELAEARREGSPKDTAVLLIVDDLNFIENLGFEAQINLHWLLAYGTPVGIWPIGTLKACYAPDFHYWIETFRTLIIGSIESKLTGETLTNHLNAQAHHLDPGSFQVWTGKHWFAFALPLLGN